MSSLQRIAFRNVRLNWRHSLAALLSIAASFFSLVVFQGYIHNVEGLYYDSYRFRNMYGDLIIENQNLRTREGRLDPLGFYLNQSEQGFIKSFVQKNQDKINSSVRILHISGLITNGKTSAIFIGKGYDLAEGLKMRGDHWRWDTLYGKPLGITTDPVGLSLGQSLGKILNCKPLNPQNVAASGGGYIPEDRPFECERPDLQLSVSTESGQLNALDMTATALMDGGYRDIDSKLVNMSLENAQILLNTQKISQQTIRLNRSQDAEAVINDFNQSASDKFPELRAQKWQDHEAGEMYRKTVSLLSIFRNFVVIVIVTISCLSVLNTMIKVVKERTREIGTLLSLGFRRSQVMGIFLQEAMLLALLGCAMGALGAGIAGSIINRIPIYYKAGLLSQPVLFQVDFSFYSYVFSALMLIVLTVTTSFFACRGTLNQKIIECLTHA